MAGLMLMCARSEGATARSPAQVQRCAELMVPDNILPRPSLVSYEQGVVAVVVNPGSSTLTRERSIAVGHLYEPLERWWEPGEEVPDGAFALCRVDDRRIELVTDLYASRTIWYVHTDSMFAASSSQRALVALLGDLELNHEAVSWMASSGYLPPRAGWDRRLHKVPPASRVALDRERWHLSVSRHVVPIAPSEGPEKEHVERLRSTIMDACARLEVPWQTWRLALSGGMDSRSIALGLVRSGKKPSCITWGLARARADKKNDAAIAPRVARSLGLPHKYYTTDFTGEPLDLVLGRFVAVSEGQLDHFDAYTDGLRMWKRLFEAGVEGVIRGDEPSQGYRWYYASEDQLRLRSQAHLVRDYPPTHPIHRLGLAAQTWPDEFRRSSGESLMAYSGRLFQEFLSPAMLPALNDMKGCYMEVANPLLSRPVVAVCHALPASLRRGRRAAQAMHKTMKLDIPFADRSAPASRNQFFAHPGFCEELRRGLSLPSAAQLFSEEAVAAIGQTLAASTPASLWAHYRPRVKEVIPPRVLEHVKPLPTLTASGWRLAFRAYIAVRMTELLTRDAATLQARAG